MTVIRLTQGQETEVPDDLYASLVSGPKWFAKKDYNTFYAARNAVVHGRRITERLHRIILELRGFDIEGLLIDHRDGNGLNNIDRNLRIATSSQNQHNGRRRKNNTSGYVGVTWDAHSGRWASQLIVNRKHKFLGYFDDPIDAAVAYDSAATKHFCDFAKVNFPD